MPAGLGNEGGLRPESFSEPREIFQNQFLRLYAVKADFGEFEREYFVTDKGQRVGVLIFRDGKVLLVRQYRYLIDDMSWELPGGGIAESETPEEAAIRECREEAGIICDTVHPVFDFQQGIDTTKSPAWIFECDSFEVLPEFENNETDDRQWVEYDEAVQMALDGRILDSMTIVALFAHSLKRSSP